MFNILGILVALVIAEAAAGHGLLVGWESALAAGVAVVIALAFQQSLASHVVGSWRWLKLRRLAAELQTGPELQTALAAEREVVLRRAGQLRLGTEFLTAVLFACICFLFGWTDYVRTVLGVPAYLHIAPTLMPWLLMQMAGWTSQYRVEREVRGGDWKALAYFGFHLRVTLMLLLPVVTVSALFWAMLRYVSSADDVIASFEILSIAVQMMMAAGVMTLAPMLLRFVLPVKPLPDGRLRRRLLSLARDARVGVDQVFLWRTGGNAFVNAMAVGIARPFRYVFLTDALLNTMREDEVVAVFAHELGHLKHRHLLWLLGFVLSFQVLVLAIWQIAAYVPDGTSAEAFLAAILAGYGFVLFGYVSRRFERQADDFAARHTDPELISSVLLKLDVGSRRAMQKGSLRYFSIERRVREILLSHSHPEVRREFAHELRRSLALGIGVTVLAALALVQPVHEDFVAGMAAYSLNQYDRARATGANPARVHELRELALQRTHAMAELGDDYARAAAWYDAVVEGLEVGESAKLQLLVSEAAERSRTSEQPKDRDAWELERQRLIATEDGIRRARENRTRFATEYEAALRRRNLKRSQ